MYKNSVSCIYCIKTMSSEDPTPLSFAPWSLRTFSAVSFVGAAANLSSAIRIVKTFDLRKVISALVLCDAATGFLCCAAHCATALVVQRTNGIAACTALYLSGSLPLLVAPLISAQVAYIR